MPTSNTQYVIPDWPAPANVCALTTLRSCDDSYLQLLPSDPVWLNQVHGNQVVCIDQINPLNNTKPDADASISFKPHTVCVIRTADCLPILICDQAGTKVAAIHAGWRSLAAGIIGNTLEQLGSGEYLAWLGPCISSNAFEVGQEVPDGFLSFGWASEHVKQGFMPKPGVADKWLGNLPHLAKIALHQYGLLDENIYGGNRCTYSEPEKFYSYRRSKDTGRMHSLIWRK